MKHKRLWIRAGVALLSVLLAGMLIGYIWWYSPTFFLKDVIPADVVRIEVFNGSTGQRFSIEDAADMEYIVRKIGDVKMRKEAYEHVDGFTYSLSFVAADGTKIAQFILDSSDTIRDGAIRYGAVLETEEDALCFEYIKALEKAQRNHPTK